MARRSVTCASCGETVDRTRLQRTPTVVALTVFCPYCGEQFSRVSPPDRRRHRGLE